jgi:hypothetical protein
MPTTPGGLPYPAGGDIPAGHDQIKALALALDPVFVPYQRILSDTAPGAVANNTVTLVTGGLNADAGDSGNSLLTYGAGILTAVKACRVTIWGYVVWAANANGTRALDINAAGVAYRQTGAAQATGVSGVAMTIPHVSLNAGQTIQLGVYQNSGASLAPTAIRLRVIAEPAP